MPKLKPYASQEEIPEALTDYYIEKDGQWVPNIDGVKTQSDVDRVKRSLDNERDENEELKRKLSKYPDDFDPEKWEEVKHLDPDDLPSSDIDPEDEEAINKHVSQAVREREEELRKEFKEREEELKGQITEEKQKYQSQYKWSQINKILEEKYGMTDPDMREAFLLRVQHSSNPDYQDARKMIEKIEVQEEGGSYQMVGGEYKDKKGALELLEGISEMDIVKKFRPADDTTGAGAGNGPGGGDGPSDNPFKKDEEGKYNRTKAGRIINNNPEKARRLAKQAGWPEKLITW